MAIAKLLGDTLQGKAGPVPTASLEGKTVLLYFSAHWCPPCRQFTPVLAKFYNDLRGKRQDFEIVFCSSDRDEAQFTEYYREHPWLALPFADRKRKDKLSRKFGVQGIPMLCVVSADGELITKDGRARVSEDPAAAKFPWKPRSSLEILTDAIVSKSGKKITVDELKGKKSFAIYFSAHWCPPCRAFTPKLVSLYTQLKAKHGDAMEFIFASRDKDQAAFDEYYHEMPWATIIFGHPAVNELATLFSVQGIPTLVTLNGADGKVINDDARGLAAEDEDGSKYPWAPEALDTVSDLIPSDAVIEALNSKICFSLAVNGSSNKETQIAEFTKAALAVTGALGPEKSKQLQFFIVKADDLFERVLQVLQVQVPAAGKAYVLAMNLPNNKAKELLSGDISEASVAALANKFFAAQADEE
jgi:nucleoredoxin